MPALFSIAFSTLENARSWDAALDTYVKWMLPAQPLLLFMNTLPLKRKSTMEFLRGVLTRRAFVRRKFIGSRVVYTYKVAYPTWGSPRALSLCGKEKLGTSRARIP